MRIGISVITQAGQNIWNNGLTQNVVFLARLFQQIPFVSAVVFLNSGDQTEMPAGAESMVPGVPLVPYRQATDKVDVVLEMAGGLDVQWLDYMRACGKKVVGYVAGQPFCGLVEPPVFEKPGYAVRPDRYDAVWLIPEYQAFTQMLRAMHRCPTSVVPYLWSPHFLQQRIAEVKSLGFQYGFVPRPKDATAQRQPLRVAIFEPNISVAKTSSISMLACDEAYRANPNSVGMMSVLNTLHLKDHSTMLYLANSLSLVKEHKAVFLGRHDIVGFMVQQADAVVSHQWENNQNYSYLDALYGHYPLVHNSPWIKDIGYYYPEFDCKEGGRQLLRAYAHHEENMPAQARLISALFASLDPLAPTNIAAYTQLLLALTGEQP